jgi:cell division protein FtsZ
VGIVTIPFEFEGKVRYHHALRGIEALSQNVDSMLLINNETLREKLVILKLAKLLVEPMIY